MTVSRTLPDHATHRHRQYGLTCEQYEALITESGRCCQTCQAPSNTSTYAKLAIDHDHKVGDWAVRGLLCHRCNAALHAKREADPPDWALAYLANPWYVRMLRDLNVNPDPPEPDHWMLLGNGYPSGPLVKDFRGRIWNREDGLWGGGSWKSLLYYLGPHNLTPHFIEGAPVITADEAREALVVWKRECATDREASAAAAAAIFAAYGEG